MERHELTDVQWEVLEPCLPPLNTSRGCKMLNNIIHAPVTVQTLNDGHGVLADCALSSTDSPLPIAPLVVL